jgi:uncharacterized protein (TIGR00290 family)
MKTNNAAVLWTGGKDSCLALYEAHLAGYQIKYLVTLTPANPNFLAHPISFMKLQSEALQIPHLTIVITEPYKESYLKAFQMLKEQYSINTLITGDIDEIDGHTNIVKEYADEINLAVFFPLWKKDRKEVMNKFLEYNFRWIFSLVKQAHFTSEWVGRNFNMDAYNDLLALEEKSGIDICGENGEYHTLVLDTLLFKKKIKIERYSKEEKDSMWYIKIEEVSLKNK